METRPATAADRAWMATVLTERWGSTTITSAGRQHDAQALPAWIAQAPERRCGLLTYHIDGESMEIVTLDALQTRHGIGTVLLQRVEYTARKRGIRRLWLVTSNDNLDALRFYQRRGFRLCAVRPGAVEQARSQKPSIPVTGHYGIPLRDEIELDIAL